MATVQDAIINPALQDIGALAQGETPSTTETAQALIALNQILSSWSLERRTVYTQKHGAFTITAGVNIYTMGSGGTWNTTARPVRITAAFSYFGTAPAVFQQGCEVMPMAEYTRSIVNGQGVTAVLPTKLGVDSAAPLVNVHVWPNPSTTATIDVHYWEPLTAFAAESDTVNFPVPGFDMALRLELALMLGPSFGAPLDKLQAVMKMAEIAKSRISAANESNDVAPAVAPQVNQ